MNRDWNYLTVIIEKMRKDDISSAAVFPKLRMILKADIKVLEQIKISKKDDSDISDLIDSLICAKNKILDHFPSKVDFKTYAKTNSNEFRIVKYRKEMKENERRLISALKNIEQEQLNFVKNAISEDGMPKDMKHSLKDILKIYESINDQLNRSHKTNQLNSIVV